jgi:hypothetical protein
MSEVKTVLGTGVCLVALAFRPTYKKKGGTGQNQSEPDRTGQNR